MNSMIDKDRVSNFLLNPQLRWLRHLLLQVVVMLITINVFWYEPLQSLDLIDRFWGWFMYFVLINTAIYVNNCWLIPRFLLKNRFLLYSFFLLLICMVLLILFALIQQQIYASLMHSIDKGIFLMMLEFASGAFTIVLIASGISAIQLFRHWMRYNQRIDELQSNTLQSELRFLKNQINPHFLFNMLNNANVLIKRDPKEASKILFKLEDLLRYQINDSSRELVSLESDIHFLTDYLNLEKIRRDKFDFTVTTKGEIKTVRIQPLLFIPFVENAVKHSFDSEHSSYVHVTFEMQDSQLQFFCKNSRSARVIDKRKVGGIGLANIRRRLELLYPGRYLLERSETETCYTVILYLTL